MYTSDDEDRQYNGVWGESAWRGQRFDTFEESLEHEQALRHISQLPPGRRKAALRDWQLRHGMRSCT